MNSPSATWHDEIGEDGVVICADFPGKPLHWHALDRLYHKLEGYEFEQWQAYVGWGSGNLTSSGVAAFEVLLLGLRLQGHLTAENVAYYRHRAAANLRHQQEAATAYRLSRGNRKPTHQRDNPRANNQEWAPENRNRKIVRK